MGSANAVYTQKLSDGNLQAELIYEESPVFVGSDANALSAVVRFTYIGELPDAEDADQLRQNHADQHRNHQNHQKAPAEHEDSSGGWFGGLGKRVSMQLSNTTRSLLLQELETLDEDETEKFSDITLLLGYTQVFGYFIYNDQIFDTGKFQEIQKRSIVGGRLAGVNGLEFETKSEDGFLTNVATGFGSIFNTSLMPDGAADDDTDQSAAHANTNPKNDIVPFFSSTQSIIFPEVVFRPRTRENLTSSTYINVKLPAFLPPTYDSATTLKIQYNLILGFQIQDNTGNWLNKSLFFPLEIRPYVNRFGQQPVYDLLAPVVGYRLTQKTFDVAPDTDVSFKDIKKKNMPLKMRRSSTMKVSTFDNEIGPNDNALDAAGDEVSDRNNFFRFLRDMNGKSVHELIGIQEVFESEFAREDSGSNSQKENVKENLLSVFNNPEKVVAQIKKHNENPVPVPDTDSNQIQYHSQIPAKQQLNFILKRNGELITTISLSKAIMTFNETLKIHLSFKNSRVPITGLITRLLKVERLNNDDYLKSEDEMISGVELSSSLEFETRLNEVLISCFNVNDELSYEMLIPNDLVRTGQFKSNLLDTRYSLLFKFVLLDKFNNDGSASKDEGSTTPTDGEDVGRDEAQDTNKSSAETYEFTEIYNDPKGSLYRGVDYISNGMEFACKIPIIVLGSNEQDFGSKSSI